MNFQESLIENQNYLSNLLLNTNEINIEEEIGGSGKTDKAKLEQNKIKKIQRKVEQKQTDNSYLE